MKKNVKNCRKKRKTLNLTKKSTIVEEITGELRRKTQYVWNLGKHIVN